MLHSFHRLALCLILNLTFFQLFGSDLKKLNIEGLSSDNINTIYSDVNGLLWIGTDQGLNRYDGLENKVFRSNPFNTTSLSGNRIWHIENYNKDTLVVISDNALHLFTPKNYLLGSFTTLVIFSNSSVLIAVTIKIIDTIIIATKLTIEAIA